MIAGLIHTGLPAGQSKKDVMLLVENLGKRGLGISSTASRLLRHYVWRSRDTDYQAGRICAVWDRVSHTAELLGLCSRGINEAERELEARGLILRSTGGNGARSGQRVDGVIRWAAGINLAPLISRYAELKTVWDGRCLHQQAIAECKAEIRHLRRMIREGERPDLFAKADTILPCGRVAPINDLERLKAIHAALSLVLDDIQRAAGATESSDRSEETVTPDIQKQDSSRPCSSRPPMAVTPRMALALASAEYRTLAGADGEPTWLRLIETSYRMAGWLGISQRAWGQACTTLGRERAALCVLVIERNARTPVGHRYQARHPGKCLSGMIRSAANGQLNLHGLLRACHGETPPPTATDPPQTCQSDAGRGGAIGSLAASILSRAAVQMGGRP
ncbi:MAG: hypothetical protein DI568_06865 [Sphingomonas sp.]|nr:MAG: hypothetical protein DI568_06865 [Sphingomonas sp.]